MSSSTIGRRFAFFAAALLLRETPTVAVPAAARRRPRLPAGNLEMRSRLCAEPDVLHGLCVELDDGVPVESLLRAPRAVRVDQGTDGGSSAPRACQKEHHLAGLDVLKGSMFSRVHGGTCLPNLSCGEFASSVCPGGVEVRWHLTFCHVKDVPLEWCRCISSPTSSKPARGQQTRCRSAPRSCQLCRRLSQTSKTQVRRSQRLADFRLRCRVARQLFRRCARVRSLARFPFHLSFGCVRRLARQCAVGGASLRFGSLRRCAPLRVELLVAQRVAAARDTFRVGIKWRQHHLLLLRRLNGSTDSGLNRTTCRPVPTAIHSDRCRRF